MSQKENTTLWSENVIVVDAEYVDRVAFNLIVNFERMLGRKIPAADMTRWIDCLALDGGIPADNPEGNISVVLIHEKDSEGFDNFVPASFGQLDGKAFKDQLGEFVFSSVAVEHLTTKDDLLLDVVQAVVESKEVRRLMVVPNAEDGDCYDRLRQSGDSGLFADAGIGYSGGGVGRRPSPLPLPLGRGVITLKH